MTGIIAAAGGTASSLQGNGVFNYWLIMALMMTGLYLILSRSNMIKTIIGLNFFQVSVIMLYVSMGKIEGATAPILVPEDTHHEASHDSDHGDAHGAVYSADHGALVDTISDQADGGLQPLSKTKPQAELKPTQAGSGVVYSNPLPHVLMLTAIVVGVATTALALSLVVRINEYYGTIEEDELEQKGALT
ncbi:MAG: cation:proton antiporter subunit C [Myxococcota bacterium]|nr:cation:proton antiporter subunit C [Myxococcota bacterium]